MMFRVVDEKQQARLFVSKTISKTGKEGSLRVQISLTRFAKFRMEANFSAALISGEATWGSSLLGLFLRESCRPSPCSVTNSPNYHSAGCGRKFPRKSFYSRQVGCSFFLRDAEFRVERVFSPLLREEEGLRNGCTRGKEPPSRFDNPGVSACLDETIFRISPGGGIRLPREKYRRILWTRICRDRGVS